MPEVKIQRDTKVILAMTEEEARHLAGFLLDASSGSNKMLRPLEEALIDLDIERPLPTYVLNGTYFILDTETE